MPLRKNPQLQIDPDARDKPPPRIPLSLDMIPPLPTPTPALPARLRLLLLAPDHVAHVRDIPLRPVITPTNAPLTGPPHSALDPLPLPADPLPEALLLQLISLLDLLRSLLASLAADPNSKSDNGQQRRDHGHNPVDPEVARHPRGPVGVGRIPVEDAHAADGRHRGRGQEHHLQDRHGAVGARVAGGDGGCVVCGGKCIVSGGRVASREERNLEGCNGKRSGESLPS